MPRIFTLGKVHRALAEFADDKGAPDQVTKRLLKGFYTQDRWELENDSEQESSKFAANVDYGKIKDILLQAKGMAGKTRPSAPAGNSGSNKRSKVLPTAKNSQRDSGVDDSVV